MIGWDSPHVSDMRAGTPAYSTSKLALNGLTRMLADDGPTGGFFRNGQPLPW